tara:strand:+ start:67069 stop:67224 length:156 start_codon:yes stop_codon:yes gene_type:complete
MIRNVWYGFSQLELSNGTLPKRHPHIASQAKVQQKAASFLRYKAPDAVAFQ